MLNKIGDINIKPTTVICTTIVKLFRIKYLLSFQKVNIKVTATMKDESFRYHSKKLVGNKGENENDFSNWIRDAIGDKALAGWISQVQDKVEAANAVASRIATLRERLREG